MKHWTRMKSPAGELILVEDDGKLLEINFVAGRHPATPPSDGIEDRRPFAIVIRQLEEYFAGKRKEFDLPLAPRGTEFQQKVWKTLTEIPHGKAVSYSDIAVRIGNPNAVRAVGLANGRNPIPIVIPCHRVIGKDGSLTGYGGGLPIKQKLLALEGIASDARGRKNLALFE